MGRAYPETQLHKSVAAYLNLVLSPATWWTSIDHSFRGKVRGGMWKSQGVKKGIPDIILLHNGWFHGIELKAEGGRVSPEQAECHKAIRTAHGKVAVCRSIDDVAESLAEWGIPSRDKIPTEKQWAAHHSKVAA
jgi:hypothetical protein